MHSLSQSPQATPGSSLPPILVISSARNLSGGLRQALYQVQTLVNAGHDARLLVGKDAQAVDIAGDTPLRQLDGPPEQWRPQVESLLPSNRPAVLHAFHNKAVKRLAHWGVRWRLAGRPTINVAHRGVCHRPGNPLPYLLPGIDCFAPNSAACAQVLKSVGVGPKRLRVVDNGVPDHRVTPGRNPADMRAELNLPEPGPESGLVIGSVLGENPLKGMEVLLRAFAAIQHAGIPAPHLLAVGTKADRWAKRAVDLGVADRVHLPGRRNNVADYLQVCDIFVLPSLGKQDSQPNVLLEALRMGLPAVVSDVGGSAEALGDAGVVVLPGDVSALARALERLVEAPDLLVHFAEKARARGDRFRPQARLLALTNLYAELLDRRGFSRGLA